MVNIYQILFPAERGKWHFFAFPRTLPKSPGSGAKQTFPVAAELFVTRLPAPGIPCVETLVERAVCGNKIPQ